MKQLFNTRIHLDAPHELILVRLLTTMGAAAVFATASLYLSSLGMSDAHIGISTSVVMAINLLFALSLSFILKSFNLTRILLGSTIGFTITLLLFGSVDKALFALFFYVIARLLFSLFASAYSILFHDDSISEKAYKKNVALGGSINNFAWMSIPLIATLLIAEYSFTILYISASILTIVASLFLLLKKLPEKQKNGSSIPSNLFKNIDYYFSQKRLRDAYIISSGVDMWWVFMFTFMTLFLKDAGFSTTSIGFFLALTQLPLFLFEFKTHVFVERFKYRKPFVFNYALMALVLLAFSIWGINYITLGAIILTSFCLVYLEPAKEMYLYEKINFPRPYGRGISGFKPIEDCFDQRQLGLADQYSFV